MWIIFGWEKKQAVLGEIGTAYCFDCRRESAWAVWTESEWLTLSAIRVFRFIHRHHIKCTGCTAVFALNPAEFRTIDRHMRQHDSINGSEMHTALAKRIETEQLASKTPLQLKFIRESMKADEEYKARIRAQNERNA
jgi:hypothetical protein